ncbi:hypothetical protein Hanom_Chr16g01518571 [Helianthus anomalus]
MPKERVTQKQIQSVKQASKQNIYVIKQNKMNYYYYLQKSCEGSGLKIFEHDRDTDQQTKTFEFRTF